MLKLCPTTFEIVDPDVAEIRAKVTQFDEAAVECDGARWHVDAEKDADRQQQIEALGWSVYRITGRDCMTDAEEADDDLGRTVVRAGAARRFIRNIAARHPYLTRKKWLASAT